MAFAGMVVGGNMVVVGGMVFDIVVDNMVKVLEVLVGDSLGSGERSFVG